MNSSRAFVFGFLIGLLIFLLANFLAAHLLSDCGLPAVLGVSYSADDIVRIGFPFIFFEQDGFDFHSNFNTPFLLLDLFIGLDMAVLAGFSMRFHEKRNAQQ